MLISQKMEDTYSKISVTVQTSFVRQIRRSADTIRSLRLRNPRRTHMHRRHHAEPLERQPGARRS